MIVGILLHDIKKIELSCGFGVIFTWCFWIDLCISGGSVLVNFLKYKNGDGDELVYFPFTVGLVIKYYSTLE